MTGARKRPAASAIRLRREHALGQVKAARQALTSALHDVLANRSSRCATGCRGWYVGLALGADPYRIHVCEDCARANGYEGDVSDADVAGLPEAVRALAKAVAESDAPARI